MKLYMDDNMADRDLVALLRKRGHQVTIPADADKVGVSDPKHLAYAISHDLLVVTQDREDFSDLHDLVMASKGAHPGIVLIYSENDPTRDMSHRGIATALGKLERSGAPLANELHVLNHWR